MKKQNLFKAAVLGTVLLSGVAMAQPAPLAPGAQCPFGTPGAMRGQRGMIGCQLRQGQKGMLGGQQGMRRGGRALGCEMGERPCLNPERLAAAGVKEEQLVALEAFTNACQAERIELQAAVQSAQLNLQQAVHAEQPDEKAVAVAIDQLNKARADATLAGVSARLKMRELLGDDVAKKLRATTPQGRGFSAPGVGARRSGLRGGPPVGAPEAK